MKKLFILISITSFLALASCNNDSDIIQEASLDKPQKSESVQELTQQLKEYNRQFQLQTDDDSGIPRRVKITYSKGDIVKIAIADVKGGLRGVGGGAGGVIVGAATSSLIKFGKITLKKFLWGYIKENYTRPHIYKSNGTCIYGDSIGFYHNELEYAIYSADRESCEKNSIELVSNANARLLTMSNGFNLHKGLTFAQQQFIATSINKIRNVDENLSFADYCKELKSLNPEDASYIDYCAEYIYTAVYSNSSDIDEYTKGIFYQIQHSNVSNTDKQILYQGVQVAYASILYSQNMTFKNINN